VAANAGAKRIVLLGFDMNVNDEGCQWWHTVYTRNNAVARNKLPFARHLRGFGQIAIDARKRGIELLNASPASAIREIRKVKLKDVL
jgi:uncharacterized Rossmann fold enzyme